MFLRKSLSFLYSFLIIEREDRMNCQILINSFEDGQMSNFDKSAIINSKPQSMLRLQDFFLQRNFSSVSSTSINHHAANTWCSQLLVMMKRINSIVRFSYQTYALHLTTKYFFCLSSFKFCKSSWLAAVYTSTKSNKVVFHLWSNTWQIFRPITGQNFTKNSKTIFLKWRILFNEDLEYNQATNYFT